MDIESDEACSPPEAKTTSPGRLIHVGNISLDKLDLNTLSPGAMLNDAIIDAYLLVLASASEKSVSTFSIHALASMMNTPVSHALTTHLNEQGNPVNKSEIWLVPFTLEPYIGLKHWVMFVVSHTSRKIIWIDSMGSKRPPHRPLSDLLALVTAGRRPMTWNGWSLVLPDNTPRQDDGVSCGLHVCMYAEATCARRDRHTGDTEEARRAFFLGYREEIREALEQVRYHILYRE